jgi:uncharacterized membrane protein YdjX (TVP38/TMEM64 family)
MSVTPPVESKGTRFAALRLAVLVSIAVGMIAIFRYTDLGDAMTGERIEALREKLGVWAIPAYIAIYAVLIGLWVPGTILTSLGAVFFDRMTLVPLAYLGAVFGAAFGFWVARLIGGDAMEELFGNRFALYRRYSDRMRVRGFETMLYLRIVPTPFSAISYLGGLSRMTFASYIGATAVGIIPGSIAFTLLLGTIVQGIRDRDFSVLFSWESLAILCLFIPVALLPRVIRAGQSRWGWFGGPDNAAP